MKSTRNLQARSSLCCVFSVCCCFLVFPVVSLFVVFFQFRFGFWFCFCLLFLVFFCLGGFSFFVVFFFRFQFFLFFSLFFVGVVFRSVCCRCVPVIFGGLQLIPAPKLKVFLPSQRSKPRFNDSLLSLPTQQRLNLSKVSVRPVWKGLHQLFFKRWL